MRIDRYSASDKAVWDSFVAHSVNGTFLFMRDYMDYHQNRFPDHSLLVWNEKEKLVALLPAHQDGDSINSHAGLTYGGFIIDESMKLATVLEVFYASLTFLRQQGFRQLIYKVIPHIYHKSPAEGDLYALGLCNAQVTKRTVLVAVNLAAPIEFQQRRIRAIKRARQVGLRFCQSDDLGAYWQLLSQVLWENFQAKPVHSLQEISLLKGRFPENIKLYACYEQDTLLAGVLVYETTQVVRSQYIAVSSQGRENGALDLVFDHLLHEVYTHKHYFDFGTSGGTHEPSINRGLIEQKEGFGARSIAQDHYTIDLATWKPDILRNALE
jgi:hypothetical protein